MVSRIPPVSPASTRFTYRASKTFSCWRMAADRVDPPSTEARVAVSTFWKTLFSCCPARISRHCTRGNPASIITENWRVKTASSLASTPPPNVGRLNSLPFSDILVTLICWRLRLPISSDLFAAANSPLTAAPARLVPRYVNTGIVLSSSNSYCPILSLVPGRQLYWSGGLPSMFQGRQIHPAHISGGLPFLPQGQQVQPALYSGGLPFLPQGQQVQPAPGVSV